MNLFITDHEIAEKIAYLNLKLQEVEKVFCSYDLGLVPIFGAE